MPIAAMAAAPAWRPARPGRFGSPEKASGEPEPPASPFYYQLSIIKATGCAPAARTSSVLLGALLGIRFLDVALEGIVHQRRCIDLRHMALRAIVASG